MKVGASNGAHLQLSATQYLKRRRGKGRSGYRWYVRVLVPSDLREILRRKTIERALNTSDFKEAQKRRYAVIAEIFADYERARQHRITSEDIEQEAQRYLRERLKVIQARPGTAFENVIDEYGNEYGLGGERVLLDYHQALEDKDWPGNIELEAADIARRYSLPNSPRMNSRTEACQEPLMGVCYRSSSRV